MLVCQLQIREADHVACDRSDVSHSKLGGGRDGPVVVAVFTCLAWLMQQQQQQQKQ
eukprot:CAMPEP_0172696032 /NCGR_PEP_ID=MMETSP1074-20121228/27765_1 /TAXON_ID=2916 /ORGANISM="Ceratium fusus, Strain PA161109" /LENGTH=55 /DNA_ID=CAMNT_0013516719 /DNA_START=184 /DNA_END=348 /DNA_ORIENTATION=-